MLEQVTVQLAGRALFNLTGTVAPGEVLSVMGPSGSGKSSLIAFIGGFLDPAFAASGRVLIGGTDLCAVPPEDRHVGILFQDPLLFPHMSVGGNLLFAIPQKVKGRAKRRRLAEEALAEVGLADSFDRDPDTLSGGQKARVALARVLVSGPRMLMLDEPFSKLDMELRSQIRSLVFARAQLKRLPVLLVTHDQADAEAAGGAVTRIGDEE